MPTWREPDGHWASQKTGQFIFILPSRQIYVLHRGSFGRLYGPFGQNFHARGFERLFAQLLIFSEDLYSELQHLFCQLLILTSP
jgi:hypothetical protein